MNPVLGFILSCFVLNAAVAIPISIVSVDDKALGKTFKISRDDLSTSIPTIVKRRAPRNVRFPAVITFAANGEAWLYINQVEEEHINDPEVVKQYFYYAMKGDVISLKVRSNGYLQGIAVNVEYQGTGYPSNGKPDCSWKAHKSTGPYSSWKSTSYSSCSWYCPVPAKANIVKASKFPYLTGASYVWASPLGRGHQDEIWIRHMVGGEGCQKQDHKPRKRLTLCNIRDPRCQHMWGLLGDLKKDNTYETVAESSNTDDECRCRSSGEISKCYRMRFNGSKFGLCDPHVCAPKYECVKDGGDDLPKCVKRVTASRVLPHPKYRRCCETVTTSPTIFYVRSNEY